MFGSALVYSGLIVTCAGLVAVIRPTPRIHLDTRLRGLALAGAGLCLATGALLLPAVETRVGAPATRLDAFAPAWQFHEVHTRRIAAPPARVFDAIKQVRADEILLFRTLTWIRRGGRQLPPGIMNAGSQEPLLDMATKGGFITLADDRPREVVVGTVVHAPAVRRLLARDLPGQRAHPADVASRHRTPRTRVNRERPACRRRCGGRSISRREFGGTDAAIVASTPAPTSTPQCARRYSHRSACTASIRVARHAGT